MEQLDVNPRILTALRRAKLWDVAKILHLSSSELERCTGLSTQDVTSLLEAVTQAVKTPAPITVLEMHKGKGPSQYNPKTLTTGCDVLDAFLKGGIRSQGITEIAGESAAGKTQLCMQLCITTQLPTDLGGLAGDAVFICTEDVFPDKRLMQMVKLLKGRCGSDPQVAQRAFTDHIYIQHAADLESLRSCVFTHLPRLLHQRPVKLVVLDSIAALFRCEFGAGEMVKRSKQLAAFGMQLRKLANGHNIPVVCVNQVSDLIHSESSPSPGPCRKKVVPALGLTWATLVTTRLMLTRTSQNLRYFPQRGTAASDDGKREGPGSYDVNIRHMEVLFAPHLPTTICRYIIDQEGVKGLG